MSNKEVINKLSELEEFFFYTVSNTPEELKPFWRVLVEMHTNCRVMTAQWHNITGEMID